MAAIPRETGRALSALRAATRAQHASIEARAPIARPDAGRREYADHVVAMHGWLSAIQDRQWDTKLQWLREDIAIAQADGFFVDMPAPAAPICFSSQAERLGWCYVIEGSMLGGRVLLERLRDRLAPWPARYLDGNGRETGRRWRRFLEALDQQVRSEAQIAEAVNGARAAFASLDEWFNRLMTSAAKG